MYVWGEVTYSDIFGKAHYTKFRLFFGGDGSEHGLLKACREGNEAN